MKQVPSQNCVATPKGKSTGTSTLSTSRSEVSMKDNLEKRNLESYEKEHMNTWAVHGKDVRKLQGDEMLIVELQQYSGKKTVKTDWQENARASDKYNER